LKAGLPAHAESNEDWWSQLALDDALQKNKIPVAAV